MAPHSSAHLLAAMAKHDAADDEWAANGLDSDADNGSDTAFASAVADEDDFVTTISDNDDIPREASDSEPEVNGREARKRKREEPSTAGRKKQKQRRIESEDQEDKEESPRPGQAADDGAMDSDFEFEVPDLEAGVVAEFDPWEGTEARQAKKGVDIDEIVQSRRDAQKKKALARQLESDDTQDEEDDDDNQDLDDMDVDREDDDEEEDEDEDEDELLASDGFGMGARLDGRESDEDDDDSENEDIDDDSNNDSTASPVAHPDDASVSEDDPEERAREEAFFAPTAAQSTASAKLSTTFQSMSLSRPILRGLAALGFSEPTPIQSKTIPVALLGKDVVGGAVTGSGKTAAFMIPILERLLYRPRKIPTTRVVILMPTRELAVQCYNVARKLASYTDVTFAQIVGGFSLREQENVLRRRPDVVIATPGRFIDHMRNSAAFAVDAVEILVLDEADRMLEDGFADELNEILTTIPRSRQTMLFSATMTSRVDQLIRVGLQRPVRLLVDAQRATVGTLTQEFVRLRPGREDKRLAYLMQLVSTVYTARCIIFFRQKKEAHRVRVLFSLCDIRAAELHGSMSQEQRLAAVEAFRAGTVTHLLATDVASRGLDIRGVDAVLNYEAPQNHAIYLHRVGRTARAGRVGRACTLAAETDRKVVRAVVKAAKSQGARVAGRAVDSAAVDEWAKRLVALDDEIRAVLEDEQQQRALAAADMQVRKGENLLAHADEIAARPKRTWFATTAEKAASKRAGRAELNGTEDKKPVALVTRTVSNKDRKRHEAKEERSGQRLFKKNREDRGAVAGKAKSSGSAAKSKGKRAEGRHQRKLAGAKTGSKGKKRR